MRYQERHSDYDAVEASHVHAGRRLDQRFQAGGRDRIPRWFELRNQPIDLLDRLRTALSQAGDDDLLHLADSTAAALRTRRTLWSR